MHVTENKKNILKIIFSKVKKDECIVFLFGTYAKGNPIRTSDIDIGIISNNKILPRDFLEIEESLNNDIPTLHEIDFVDFADLAIEIKKEALKEIKIWHKGKNCQELLKNLKKV
jgi:predicted nucleotidyltransferase